MYSVSDSSSIHVIEQRIQICFLRFLFHFKQVGCLQPKDFFVDSIAAFTSPFYIVFRKTTRNDITCRQKSENFRESH